MNEECNNKRLMEQSGKDKVSCPGRLALLITMYHDIRAGFWFWYSTDTPTSRDIGWTICTFLQTEHRLQHIAHPLSRVNYAMEVQKAAEVP